MSDVNSISQMRKGRRERSSPFAPVATGRLPRTSRLQVSSGRTTSPQSHSVRRGGPARPPSLDPYNRWSTLWNREDTTNWKEARPPHGPGGYGSAAATRGGWPTFSVGHVGRVRQVGEGVAPANRERRSSDLGPGHSWRRPSGRTFGEAGLLRPAHEGRG